MGKPEQHLPEQSYVCKDCGGSFSSAEGFRDHFEREGLNITGCRTGKVATVSREN